MSFNLLRTTDRHLEDGTRRYVARFLYERLAASQALDHPPREVERVNLSVVVNVTPVMDGEPRLDHAFFTITKNISLKGVAFIVNRPLEFDDVLIGFRASGDREMTHLRAVVRHQAPIGGGFRQVGVEFLNVFDAQNHPELRALEL